MKKQKGNMLLTVVLGVLMLFVVIGGIIASSYISNYNYGNRAEETIKTEYKNMENILGQYSLKIGEAAQIPSMQADDLQRIFTNTLDARYGSDGSQATFQWLKEQNPQLDQSTYLKLQTMIEGGRNKFENAQTKFLDTKRVYTTNLGYFWKGMWLRIAGYPKIDLESYKIISSDHAIDTFKTGVDTGLKLR